MKITDSDVTLASKHVYQAQRDVQESLRTWVGATRPDFEGRHAGTIPQAAPQIPARTSSEVQLSDASRYAQSQEAQAIQDAGDAAENDPRIRLIKSLLEYMLGHEIRLFDASRLAGSTESNSTTPASTNSSTLQAQSQAQSSPQPPSQSQLKGFGTEYDYHASYTETEHTSFQASGVIHTADNREIKFDLSLELQRSYHEEVNVSERSGDAKKIDPLILNFSGGAAQLTSQKFAFDLNADGKTENISFVQGAGFLAIDKNVDGKINDGKELFGPNTGNGFAELKAYDSDGNGWIDENDPAYALLKIWSKDGAGKDQLQSLKQANVGALFLGNSATEFAIKDDKNQTQAQLVSSGLWLSEDGKAHSLQQIDLVA
ncbi:MAG: hypothetical protein K2P84_05470 [Undibacterium sp.]|nr:hypothetical protein [Undibacterium sp.]